MVGVTGKSETSCDTIKEGRSKPQNKGNVSSRKCTRNEPTEEGFETQSRIYTGRVLRKGPEIDFFWEGQIEILFGSKNRKY